MLKGMEYSTPIVGTVRMSRWVGEEGEGQAAHTDYFTIHSRRKDSSGAWVPHKLHETMLEKHGREGKSSGVRKLRAIPITVAYNDVDLSVTQRLEARDLRDGKLVCAGDGEYASRRARGAAAAESVACVGCEQCPFAASDDIQCRRQTKFVFRIEGQDDEFSAFVLRSAGRNTAQTLMTKLHAMRAAFGGKLVGVPLWLKMRDIASLDPVTFQPVFYADVTLRDIDALGAATRAREYAQAQSAAGFDQEEMEATLKALRASTAEAVDDFEEVVDFYRTERRPANETNAAQTTQAAQNSVATADKEGTSVVLEVAGRASPAGNAAPSADAGNARQRMRAAARAASAPSHAPRSEPAFRNFGREMAESFGLADAASVRGHADGTPALPSAVIPFTPDAGRALIATPRTTPAALLAIPDMPATGGDCEI